MDTVQGELTQLFKRVRGGGHEEVKLLKKLQGYKGKRTDTCCGGLLRRQ